MATSHSPSGIDLSDYALETIRDDGAFVLYRGFRTATSGHPASILVVTHKAEHPRLESLEMLKHEHALRFDLDATWAVRPLALVHLQCRTYLVLDDPGGELLARRLGTQPMELGLFLRLGVGLAAALGALHRRGFMHKDLTPDHVMIDEATGRVWLTGFRIASPVRGPRPAPEPPQ